MRPLVRLPLRRYIHSFPSSATIAPRRVPDRTKLVLGASLTIAGYVTWRIAGSDQRIALDAPTPQRRPQQASAFPDEEKADTGVAPPSDSPTVAEDEPPSLRAQVEHEGEEEDEEGQSAFNPVTGEINWDCPCLGGMAHGPCGQQFREAFSCFVYSEQEPKGIDCVEKFKNMQDCFREHPDVYGEEIADDDDDVPELSMEGKTSLDEPPESSSPQTPPSPSSHSPSSDKPAPLTDDTRLASKPKPREKQ